MSDVYLKMMPGDEEMSWSLSSLSEGRISLSNDGQVATHPHHRQQGSSIIAVRSEQNENNKRRKLKSKVWDEIRKYKDKDGNEKAECKHCKKTFDGSSKKGTTHLKNHLDRCRANNNKRKGGAAGDEYESSSFKTTDLATPIVAVEDNGDVFDHDLISLPPCFRFSPTDEELLVLFLRRKVAGRRLSINFITEIDFYKFEPWELPSKALFGDYEWFFFSPMDRKNPEASEPNRVTGVGYWEDAGSGTDKIITTAGCKLAGIKKALVYYKGNAPNGIKTEWIMHEYRLIEPPPNNDSSKLDDWILCRISQCRGSSGTFHLQQSFIEYTSLENVFYINLGCV